MSKALPAPPPSTTTVTDPYWLADYRRRQRVAAIVRRIETVDALDTELRGILLSAVMTVPALDEK